MIIANLRFVYLTDGEKVDETFWKHGEPNDKNGEDCASSLKGDKATVGFGWNDLPCVEEWYFICQLA